MSQKTARRARAQRGAARSMKALRRRGWSTNAKVTIGLIVAVVVGLGALFLFTQRDGGSAELVRADSHRLSSAGDGKVMVVEFLDFQCPSCAATYPEAERILQEYAGRITYVVRNYPLPMHQHAQASARAAEAAAIQGKYKEMFDKLFKNQQSWSAETATPLATFEGYAQEIGLDVAKFKSDMDSQEVAARISRDVSDGNSAGVKGTPTFFINGKQLSASPTYEGLKSAIDAAMAQ
jgi:protein-disulfide isomerase